MKVLNLADRGDVAVTQDWFLLCPESAVYKPFLLFCEALLAFYGSLVLSFLEARGLELTAFLQPENM